MDEKNMSNDNYSLYAKTDTYSIFQCDNDKSNYYLAIPNEPTDAYQLFVGFPQNDFRYSKKEDIINEIHNVKKIIPSINKNGIYILLDIPLDRLEDAALENDNKMFSKLLNNTIQPLISDVYLKLKQYDSNEKTIDQLIYFVKQSNNDTKFIQWLEINLPNFIRGISYDEIYNNYLANTQEEDIDLDKTVVLSMDQLQEYDAKVKENGKKRILAKPNLNTFGYGNMSILMCLLSFLYLMVIIFINLLLK